MQNLGVLPPIFLLKYWKKEKEEGDLFGSMLNSHGVTKEKEPSRGLHAERRAQVPGAIDVDPADFRNLPWIILRKNTCFIMHA